MSSIIFIHFKTLGKIIYLNCVKHFGVKRFLITVVSIIIIFFIGFTTIFFRVLDEIFFPSFKKTIIKQPVFILGNPRSGTTFLHRLLCLDGQRYTAMKLYHTIIPAVSFYKLVDIFVFIDDKIGKPGYALTKWLDNLFFSKWQNIHPTGFNKTEEDEGFYIFTFLTVAVCLLCPYMEHFKYLTVIDNLDEKTKKKLKSYYKSSIKRLVYSCDQSKILLNKNVISTGRLNLMLEIFPDARLVYLVRNPKETIPSFVSMFSVTWPFLSPELKHNKQAYKALGQVAMEFYKHFHTQKEKINKANLFILTYNEFIKSPKASVLKIYEYYNLHLSEDFMTNLEADLNKSTYKAGAHQYYLKEYGFTEAEIETELKMIYDTFQFN